MHDNLLIPTYDLPGMYRRGEVIGAFLDADTLPSPIRKIARYNNDLFNDEQGAFKSFASAPKSNWKAGDWKGKRALLWHYWLKVDPAKAMVGAQSTGDCVSWGERCKQEVRRCVEILQKGEREVYRKRQATCLLYSGRGHTGAGASPVGIANWATKCGILPEEEFTDSAGKKWDFAEYSNYVKLGMSYGRSGMPQAIIDITSKNRVAGQSRVATIEELCDLFWNGYATCMGFSIDTAPRGNPVSKLQGSTAHETCMVGYDDTELGRSMVKKSLGYEDTAIFYDQSWGNWNEVTDIPEEWKPWGQGMYCHSARDCQKAHLNPGEATACTGSIGGFVGGPVNNLLV